jgi:hypothetical protein
LKDPCRCKGCLQFLRSTPEKKTRKGIIYRKDGDKRLFFRGPFAPRAHIVKTAALFIHSPIFVRNNSFHINPYK